MAKNTFKLFTMRGENFEIYSPKLAKNSSNFLTEILILSSPYYTKVSVSLQVTIKPNK